MGHPVFGLGPGQFLVLRNKYRDPSLGVARLRARLRCLRMTIGFLGVAKDSREHILHVVSLALSRETISLGKTGVYIWGKENCTPGFSGSQGRFGVTG